MSQIGGWRVCGKKSEFNFKTAVRPQLNETTGSYECPDDYTHCGNAEFDIKNNLDSVICVPRSRLTDDCPITSINFVDSPLTNETEGIPFLSGYLEISKVPDSLPLTNFKIGSEPCLNSGVDTTWGWKNLESDRNKQIYC